jgi:hypothetical protein
MRRKIIIAVGVAVGTALSATVIAQQPASPAQLAAWQSQRAALQAQQQAAQNEQGALFTRTQTIQAEIARLQAILDGPFDVVHNPLGAAVAAGGKAVIQGANPLDNRSVQDRTMDNAWVAIQQRNAVREQRDQKRAELAGIQARLNQLAGEIAARDGQIAQLDRDIAYYRNPVQGDLDNERARWRNLDSQKATKDDAGQLEWDKANTKRRIDELEALQKEFQQGGTSSSGTSRGQSQGGYNTPATMSGAGSQSQPPLGHSAPWGYPPTSGPQKPNWEDLQKDLQQPRGQGGSGGHKHGGSKGGCDC